MKAKENNNRTPHPEENSAVLNTLDVLVYQSTSLGFIFLAMGIITVSSGRTMPGVLTGAGILKRYGP